VTKTKRPGWLKASPGNWDRLADGSFVLHVSTQTDWTYVRILTPDGHFRTRRYRHDQEVKVMDE
jgi:regulation of enolase protein 1 (concanavalin A-like superfamily)